MKKLVASFFIVLSLAFILLGLLRNEVDIIYNKAIMICLECIGLGK